MTIGYASLTIGVPNTQLSACILKNATQENLRRITFSNIKALAAMVDYNIAMGVKLFRISSDIIPFGSHPANRTGWQEEYREEFWTIGRKIKASGMRVSMHPGQYSVLNSPKPEVVESAMADLEYHNGILNALDVDGTNKIVLHIGGAYGDKSRAIHTFVQNYQGLPQGIKERLIIENDERNFNIQEVLWISQRTGAPVVFDNLHHALNPPMSQLSQYDWMVECEKTWGRKDGRQKIHYSQQKKSGRRGSHSDTILIEPFMEFYGGLPNREIDIMLEVKDKNISAIKCINGTREEVSEEALLEEWERYRYYILSRSGSIYHEVRELLQGQESSKVVEFYKKIEEAQGVEEDKGAQRNTAQHIWETIARDCITKTEANRYEKLLKEYQFGDGKIKSVKNHLLKCAKKRGMDDLIHSLYFYL